MGEQRAQIASWRRGKGVRKADGISRRGEAERARGGETTKHFTDSSHAVCRGKGISRRLPSFLRSGPVPTHPLPDSLAPPSLSLLISISLENETLKNPRGPRNHGLQFLWVHLYFLLWPRVLFLATSETFFCHCLCVVKHVLGKSSSTEQGDHTYKGFISKLSNIKASGPA